MLTFVQIRSADFELQICFQTFAIANHCALYAVSRIQIEIEFFFSVFKYLNKIKLK